MPNGHGNRAALHAGTEWIDALDLRASAPRIVSAGEPSIPRIIHQTYHAKELPDVLRDAAAALRTLNPEWEYRLYDDDDIERFIEAQYPPEVLELYRRLDPAYGAARADLFRYLLMYRTGGVYLDVKAQMATPLRDVLHRDDTFVSAHWRNGPGELHDGFGRFPELAWYAPGELQQWHIIAAPEHPYLDAVIRRVLRNIASYNPFRFGVGKMGVVRTTGPIPYTEAIVPLMSQHPCRMLPSESALGLAYSVFGDGARHKTLFRSHYSLLVTPLAPVTPLVAQSYEAYRRTVAAGIAVREQCYVVYRLLKRTRNRLRSTQTAGAREP